MNQKLVLITLSSFFLSSIFTIGCESSNISSSEDQIKRLPEQHIQNLLNTYADTSTGILGIMARIELSGYHHWNGSTGYYDISKTSTLSPSHKFLIGSITKMFTSAMVLQLAEDGLIDLDSCLIRYLPVNMGAVLDSIQYGNQITVYQALCHRSGIYNFSRSWTLIMQVFDDPSYEYKSIDILRLVRDEGKPDFIPGISYRYSNTNYILLGSLIQEIEQKSLQGVFYERIFKKLGMDDSFLSEGVLGSNQDGIAHGYDEEFGRLYDGQEFHSGTSWSAGGIVSTTADLNIFLRSLVSNSVFKNESTFQKMVDLGDNENYGLGIIIDDHSTEGLYIGHGGGIFGTYSTAFYYFNREMTITLCITLDGSVEYISPHNLLNILLSSLPNE
jgi:D-alanyl-D-alanine carboxypeptidase